jgi:hypothetical protein
LAILQQLIATGWSKIGMSNSAGEDNMLKDCLLLICSFTTIVLPAIVATTPFLFNNS